MAKPPDSPGDPLGYKDAIIYELHVRSFKDSNVQKLDHLQDMAVTCRWLLPFFPSPPKDDAYDISDYMNVHSMYGTIDDFQFFLAAAYECTLQFPLARPSREADACRR